MDFNNIYNLSINSLYNYFEHEYNKNLAFNVANLSKTFEQVNLFCNYETDIGFKTIFTVDDFNKLAWWSWVNDIVKDFGKLKDFTVVDFKDKLKIKNEINDWFINKCGKSLEYDFNNDIILLAVWSLYKIKYSKRFYPAYIDTPFYNSDESLTNVSYMYSDRYVNLFENSNYARIDFEMNEIYDMTIVVPKNMHESIFYYGLQNNNSIIQEKIRLIIPKIKFDTIFDFNLKNIELYRRLLRDKKLDLDNIHMLSKVWFELDYTSLNSETLTITGYSGSPGYKEDKLEKIVLINKPFWIYIKNKKCYAEIIARVNHL